MTAPFYDQQGRQINHQQAQALIAHAQIARHATPDGRYTISTVHLIAGHGNTPDGQPIIFETMVIDAEHPDHPDPPTSRAADLETAKAQHADACDAYGATINQKNQAD